MSYLGSKALAGTYHRIIGNLPPHSVYVEPFLGSGVILKIKKPAVRSVGIDADAGVIAGFDAAGLGLVELITGDALAWLPRLTLPADAVVYCDPPYLLSTRTSRHRYRHEFSADQHEQLLVLVDGLNCRVLISGYPSQLYAYRLRQWRCEAYRARTRGRTVTECLWCNFPEPAELHDWRFAGRNFRERLTLKRRVARLTTKLDRLKPRARGFVLDALHQRYFQRGLPAANAGKDAAR